MVFVEFAAVGRRGEGGEPAANLSMAALGGFVEISRKAGS